MSTNKSSGSPITVKNLWDNDDNDEESEKSYNGKTIDETYGERKLREHVLNDPDTFAGSIEPQEETVWCYSDESELIYKDTINYRECFYKIADEVLVNMIDQHRRIDEMIAKNPKLKLNRVTKLQVNIDEQTGRIVFENNGEGIDVVKHAKKNKYVPQMIFGDLLTSTNYDEKERTVGGKNGLGAKLANIFSKEFIIETVDCRRKLLYKQIFRDNMTVIEEPVITPYTRVPFTRITYLPDYERFGVKDPSKMDDWKMIKKRVVDASACTASNVTVYLNDKKINVKSFEDYINLYIGNKKETNRVFSVVNDRWEVGVCLNINGKFEQISFVNGICTDIGGRHVNHVVDNLTKKIMANINASSKKKVVMQPAHIKQQFMVFIKAIIVNPVFDSQTKRKLTSLVSKFGSKCELNNEFIETVMKLGVLKRAESDAIHDAKQGFNKSTDGKARSRKIHHPKLTDAKAAGTKFGIKCTIALTEGDSAANFIAKGIKGMNSEENKFWGWFPLRGKLLNIRSATIKQLQNNEEILMMKKILGLVEGKVYTSLSELRYGRVMIMADNDKDGHHIKALIMNLFSHKWPSLLKLEGFICDIATPINSVRKTDSRNNVLENIYFFTESEFSVWMENNNQGKGWKIKYYKGLGTFSPYEARDLLGDMKTTVYTWDNSFIDFTDKRGITKEKDITSHHFDMMFNKGDGYEDRRKIWLNTIDADEGEETILTKNNKCSYIEFINKQLKEFSRYNVQRAVPNLMDGLKPGQRKVLFSCFKKKLHDEIKVAQLAGYVSENSGYHHGEASLNGTMIGMAQDYVGTSNFNLLYPAGSFGSRMGGGKDMKTGDDAAAARYIFTYLSNACRKMFNDLDKPLLKYQSEEGAMIEPTYYLPVMPTILVNGVQGIGTGYSSTIPCYNPIDILDNQERFIKGEPMIDMIPWYRGYNGRIEKVAHQKFITIGNWSKIGKNKIRINEIPVGTNKCKSFKSYLEFLNTLLSDDSKKQHLVTDPNKGGKTGKTNLVKGSGPKASKTDASISTSVSDSSNGLIGLVKDYDVITTTDTDLVIEVEFEKDVLEQELSNDKPYHFEKNMKIACGFSISNMHLFDSNGIIKKYESPLNIIDDFCTHRKKYYEMRRQYWIRTHRHEYDKLNVKYRFITEYMDGIIDINRKDEEEITHILENANPPYPKFTKDADTSDITTNADADADDTIIKEGSYDYLLSTQFRSLTKNKLEQLRKELDNIQKKYVAFENKSDIDLWSEDILEIRREWKLTIDEWLISNKLTVIQPKKTVQVKLTKPKAKTKPKTKSKTKPKVIIVPKK